MHWTGVDSPLCPLPSLPRKWGREGRGAFFRSTEVGAGIGREFAPASGTAEIVGMPGVRMPMRRLVRIDQHAALRVAHSTAGPSAFGVRARRVLMVSFRHGVLPWPSC